MSLLWPSILLFGPPGSGKGTQAKYLSDLLALKHISTGDICRSAVSHSPLGKQLATYSNQGQLAPDALTFALLRDYITGLIATFQYNVDTQLLLLDGFPRTLQQAQLITPLLEIKLIFNLQIADEATLIARLSKRAGEQKRVDDANAFIIAQRIQSYRSQTLEALSFYPSSLIINIEAQRPRLEVLRDILFYIQKVV